MKKIFYPREDKIPMKDLIELSRQYGQDKNFVLAGGGNTSWKNQDTLWIKASGIQLRTIDAEGFVKIDLEKLDRIWSKEYPEDKREREKEVLADLLSARKEGEEAKRPSVETLLHGLLPFNYVVHTHPALVNGLTCGRKGKEEAKHLFGDTVMWIPATDPGYILAKTVKEALDDRLSKGDKFPQILLLQNHGVFVAANEPKRIREIYNILMSKLDKEIIKRPSLEEIKIDSVEIEKVSEGIRNIYGKGSAILPISNPSLLELMAEEKAEQVFKYAFTPDHIVYFGYKPLYLRNLEELSNKVGDYEREEGKKPRIIIVHSLAAFACGDKHIIASLARDLFLDDLAIAVYSESFGGSQFLPEDKINFIRRWEAENYRASIGTEGKL